MGMGTLAGFLHGIENIGLGGITLTRMEVATEEYLIDDRYDTYDPPKAIIDRIGGKLVRIKRMQQRDDPHRWVIFSGWWVTGN